MAKRIFTREKKEQMIQEAEESGFTIVANKYSVKASQLYQWRTQLCGSKSITTKNGVPDLFSEYGSDLATTKTLLREVAASAIRLTAVQKANKISDYNAANALRGIVSAFRELLDVKFKLLEHLNVPAVPLLDFGRTKTLSDFESDPEVQRASERAIVQISKDYLARKKQRTQNQLTQ